MDFAGHRIMAGHGHKLHALLKILCSVSIRDGAPVKIGAPHFVDFGKNSENSPDGKAYLVDMDASDSEDRRFGYDSWITGDEIYIARVTPGIENMNDVSTYEFWNSQVWTNDFSQIQPIATWADNMGCVAMTYNAPLKNTLCVLLTEVRPAVILILISLNQRKLPDHGKWFSILITLESRHIL